MNTRVLSPSEGDMLIPMNRVRELVGISRSKIYELMEDDAFPAPAKVGRINYFSEREIQSWIADRLSRRAVRRA